MGESAYEREQNRLREKISRETAFWSELHERIAEINQEAAELASEIHRDREKLRKMEDACRYFTYVMV
jgi:predicted  nucleic acid-binding Zn-ribbon protein